MLRPHFGSGWIGQEGRLWVETGKFDQSISNECNWSISSSRPRSQGPWPRFLPSGYGDPGSVPRGPSATARALSADTAALGALQSAVLGSGSPCRVCLRAPRHEPRPATPHRPDRSQGVKHGPQHDHLTSARVGSRASCSLRQAASRSPIREATAPMPVAPAVTPVVAVPAPPAALGYQFDSRHGTNGG
jgi:hypothetical protein